MKRGTFAQPDNNSDLDQLMQQLRDAIANGQAADSAEVMALQAQIDAVNAKADQAEQTGQNARQMVMNRDPRIATLEDLAQRLGGAVQAGDDAHARLDQRIDDIELTPGPSGKDGEPGKDSTVAGPPGRDGADSAVPGPPGRDGKDSTVPGPPGKDGTAGIDGLSAYQLARQQGYGGTLTQWLASLTGAKGDTGPAGKDANVQVEYRDGVAVPAMLSLLGSQAQSDVTITWPTPFPDANYVVTPQISTTAATLIGRTTPTVKSKTATGCVITVTTTAVVSAGQATLSAIGFRKT